MSHQHPLLTKLHHLTETNPDQPLTDTFKGWEQAKLAEFAGQASTLLLEQEGEVNYLTNRFNSTQNWALGLALVEEIGQSLASTLDLKEVLTRLLRRIYNAIDVEDGSVLLIEQPSGDLVSQVVLGQLSLDKMKPFRVPKGKGIAGRVAESGIPEIVNNAKADKRHFGGIDEQTGFVTRSILCVPLIANQRILGVLEVFNKESGDFNDHDQLLLSSIANFAGIAIENAQLHKSVVAERDRVIQMQEAVSHKLQRDLHDGPTQLVAAIEMGLDFCKKALSKQAIHLVANEVDSLYQLARRTSHQMRTLLFELRPLILETQGLVAALETFIKRRRVEVEPTQLHLILQADRLDNQISRLDTQAETVLFEIVQEAVNNAVKHAQASDIAVMLTQKGDQLTVTVRDDGQGFDVAQVFKAYDERGSYGMITLQERVEMVNGTYDLRSEIGQGTTLTVELPLQNLLV